MTWAWGLLGWSLLAMSWWGAAVWLVRRPRAGSSASGDEPPPLTIFKPVPPIRSLEEVAVFRAGIDALAQQLDAGSEMLVGLHEHDRPIWEPIVRQWRRSFPPGQVRVVFRAGADTCANPKVAWERFLAERARGQLWLWSDADVIVPDDFIATARAEWFAGRAGVLTHACVVRQVPGSAAVLETLFVNVEMLPGILLLGRMKAVRFGLGASMLFEAGRFRERIDWDDLGGHLAEDYLLGRRLGPAVLGSTVVETVAQSHRWRDAIRHYLRWQKTIRWCRPAGYAGQIVIHPLLGWGVAVALAPGAAWAWLGLVGTWALEGVIAAMLCRGVGCRLTGAGVWAAVAAWSPLRSLVWLLCWAPWPVRWRQQLWWRPTRRSGVRREEPCPIEMQTGTLSRPGL